METDLEPYEVPENLGPAMEACTEMERKFVAAYVEHPNYTAAQLAKVAGSAGATPKALQVTGWRIMHGERFLAAVNEEASKRLRLGGLIGVAVMLEIANNPAHKDRLKAAGMLADRTGFHALSEQKITVDDKRPQSKRELIEAIAAIGKEMGLDDTAILKLTGPPDPNIVDAEFTPVLSEDEVATLVEDL